MPAHTMQSAAINCQRLSALSAAEARTIRDAGPLNSNTGWRARVTLKMGYAAQYASEARQYLSAVIAGRDCLTTDDLEK